MTDNEKIRVFTTGGTFDKEYNEINGQLYFRSTHVTDMLALGRCKLEFDVTTLMMIDSLEMTETDRMVIVHNCRRAREKRIVITHGTDTMAQTAEVLAREIRDKTIVLTGAIIPYKFGSSDGLFNLGSALAFAQTLPPGIFIAMNGKWFHANEVAKNRKTGIFEPKTGEK